MSLTVSPTQLDIYTAVQAFIMGILPLDLAHVIQLDDNRDAMPLGPFVGMRLVVDRRLRTNVNSWDANENQTYEMGMQAEMQLDVYGPLAGDWSVIVSTLWRDDYACLALAPNCQPLHADEGTRAPLVNGEEQYELRYIVRAQLQYNPVVSTVVQSATVAEITPINVDVTYPPA